MKSALTGIKPTGTPHLGNYLGAIRPALNLAEQYNAYLFIADYHALTSLRDPKKMQQYVYDVAATWLACGLDPKKVLLYRQSAIPEVFELAWILSCVLATGQLERGHAYKDALEKGESPNAGVFYYPVLMSADILLYDADVVPVGKDQKQHMEVARDIAERVNHVFGEGTLVVPEAQLYEALAVPGTDGRKMSKSYDNTLPLFADAKTTKNHIMKIVTGSEALEEPKTAEGSTVYELYREIAGDEKAKEMAAKLKAGGYGWGHAKQDLALAYEEKFAPMRDVYNTLRADEAKLDGILDDGAARARVVAHKVIARVRRAVGIAK